MGIVLVQIGSTGGTAMKNKSFAKKFLAFLCAALLFVPTFSSIGMANPMPLSSEIVLETDEIEIADFAAGNNHILAVDVDGLLWSWGSNSHGQLGLASPDSYTTPQVVNVPNVEWATVAAGGNHSAAIDVDGNLWTWGANGNGQLGHNDVLARSQPTMVDSTLTWLTVSTADNRTLAIDAQNRLWGWGHGRTGQLGLGNVFQQALAPTLIDTGAQQWEYVSVSSHVLALDSAGQIWSWGFNGSGQVGNGNAQTVWTPFLVQVAGVDYWKQIVAGGMHTLAIDNNDRLWTWGFNNEGQLGIGHNSPRNVPQLVETGPTSWSAVGAGQFHSLAIDASGDLFSWGYGANGRLGLSSNDDYNTPQLITAGPSNWTQLASRGSHSLGLGADGSLWSWGVNNSGQLGNGTTIASSTPSAIAFALPASNLPPVNPPVTTYVTVTFFDPLGCCPIPERQVAAGTAIGTLTTPTRAGHTFSGWWTEPAGGTQVNAGTIISANITLFARWTPVATTPPTAPPQQAPPTETTPTPRPPVQTIVPSRVTIGNARAGEPLLVNRTRQLSANVLPTNAANRNVSWTSSNSRVATVNNRGLVRALRPGTTTITVHTQAGNQSARFTLRVQAAPSRIDSSVRTIQMRQGTTLRVPIVVRGNTNTNVTVNWRTNNRSVATLTQGRDRGTLSVRQNANRVLTLRALRPGNARITLTTLNGRTITYNIRVVRSAQRLTNVQISNLPRNNTLNRNATRNLGVRITPQRATLTGQVRWTSSRPRVATIDQAGRLQAQRRGETTITLRVGNQVQRVTITVR